MIELILVMVIIGALAIFALPAFFDSARFGEYAYHQEVMAAARFARKTAVASGCEVEFTTQAGGYALRYRGGGSDTSCGSGGFTVAVTGPDGTPYAAAPPDGVSVGSLTLYFDAQGRPRASDGSQAGGSIAVGPKSIAIETGTGYVH